MASEETKSLTESCSDTRSERGSEDRESETESLNIESVDSQKSPKKFCSDVWGYFKLCISMIFVIQKICEL